MIWIDTTEGAVNSDHVVSVENGLGDVYLLDVNCRRHYLDKEIFPDVQTFLEVLHAAEYEKVMAPRNPFPATLSAFVSEGYV